MDHPDQLRSRTTSSSSSFIFNPFGDEGQVEESKSLQNQDEAGVLYSTPRIHRQDLAKTLLQAQDDVGTTGGMASASMASTSSGFPKTSQRSLSGSTSSSLSLLDLKASLPLTSLSLVSPHIFLPSVSLPPYSSVPSVSPARTSFSTSSSQHSPVAALYSSSPQPYPPSTSPVGNPTYFPPPVSTPLASGAFPFHAQSSSMSSTPSARAPHNSVQQPPSKQPPILSTRSGSTSRQSGIPPLLPPIAGFRVPATGSKRMASFPLLEMCGPAFADCDGNPVYVCSAILGNAVHPGKAGPHLNPPVRISLSGKEVLHEGRYDLLPITSDMKWIAASNGKLPDALVPVQAGYEESGEQLFHALAKIEGYWIPGKSGLHLKGANFPFANKEVTLTEGYRILCWKNRMSRMSQKAASATYP